MKIKAILLALSMLSMMTISVLPAYAITVPNPDTFTYLTTGGPQYCDPYWAYDTASAEVIFNVYQCLIDFEFTSYDRYVAEIAESWPGYGVNEGNIIEPSPPHTHEFDSISPVLLNNPVLTNWTRKGIVYQLMEWEDNGDFELSYCDQIKMVYRYYWQNKTVTTSQILEYAFWYHVEQVIPLGGNMYHLILTPKFYDATWYFKIREGIKWQDVAYGTVTPYDCEYSFERGMVEDHSGGPMWMFFDPLTLTFGSRSSWINKGKTRLLGLIIDDAIESNGTHVWFNLKQPYLPFMQILSQSWGSIMDAGWTEAQGSWDASWHDTPGDYSSWVAYNNPVAPGHIGYKTMGCGPYYVDYIDTDKYWRLKSFDNFWGGWTKPHCDTIIHEVVALWATRKARFLTDDEETQADMVTVLRGDVGDPDLLAAVADGRVRYLPHIATLSADAIFYCYDFNEASPYMHHIGDGSGGLIANTTLLSDIHMRLALSYCFNATEFIEDYYKGEAAELHNPIIYGIAYANDTKHATMHYAKNIELATYHFKMAWGGIDYEGDGVCDVPGEIWNKGFHVTIVPFPDQPPRTEPARMIEYVCENEIPWEINPLWVDVEVAPLEWDPGLDAMLAGDLGCYVVGWLADFPDPHNWVMPFQHTEGDFSYFQNIQYGRQTMNWHPQGSYGQAGLPYTNYKGDLVTEINNAYVDGLIATGIGITDPVLREKCYNELMDIYYAECASIMTFQPEGRHYERQWVQGWFYHSIYPGLMFYGEMNLWKEDPETVTYDLESTIDLDWINNDVYFDAHNNGDYGMLIYEECEAEFDDPTGSVAPTVTWLWATGYYTKSWSSVTEKWTVKIYAYSWLPPCETKYIAKVHYWCLNTLQYANESIEITKDWELDIIEDNTVDNFLEVFHTPGDIGSATSGPISEWWYNFNGHCDGDDFFLFRDSYTKVYYHPLADFAPPTGPPDGDDFFVFRYCYIAYP